MEAVDNRGHFLTWTVRSNRVENCKFQSVKSFSKTARGIEQHDCPKCNAQLHLKCFGVYHTQWLLTWRLMRLLCFNRTYICVWCPDAILKIHTDVHLLFLLKEAVVPHLAGNRMVSDLGCGHADKARLGLANSCWIRASAASRYYTIVLNVLNNIYMCI